VPGKAPAAILLDVPPWSTEQGASCSRRERASGPRGASISFTSSWHRSSDAPTTADVRAYIEKRQAAGFQNGSINRELAALKRMFRLAGQGDHLFRVPHIPMLKEADPRAGFFEADQFRAVLGHLPAHLRLIARFAYETGWRREEVLHLEWRRVDLARGTATLDPGTTKNREGRVVFLSPALADALRAHAAATRDLQRRRGLIVPWVFHHRGVRIGSLQRSWRTACRKAGVPAMVFHGLRRTAVRTMVRAGVPERVAMQISGHKTRAVFERYNIVSEGDLRDAAARMAPLTLAMAGAAPHAPSA
jgi:integrase